MPTATAARKRKQTDDMEVSPPKRVTRARSAKTQEAPAPAPAKSARATKTTNTSRSTDKAKPAARSTKTAVASKRTTRSKDSEEPAVEEPSDEEPPATEAPKTRGRQKKTTLTEEMKAEAPKTRTRTTKPTTSKAVPATSTRTRTRAASVAEESEDELMDTSQAQADSKDGAPPKKTTRGRAAASTKSATSKGRTTTIKVTAPSTRAAASARATGATASTAARSAAAKKKVAFVEDPQDKENVPVRGKTAGKLKADEKPATTGIRGKPVRKATASAAAKAREAAASKTDEKKPTPLSPKKVDQVAKGSGSSSEDELGSRSPVPLLSRSPVKPPPSVRKELPFVNSGVPSPTKLDAQEPSSPLLNKSPMRPPQSVRRNLPFASASVPSPSKAVISSQGEALGRNPVLASSLLLSPAKRPVSPVKPVASVETGLPSKAASHLFASPAKRVRLDIPNPSQTESQPEVSLKQSLLQSPARRPKVPLGSFTALPKEKKPAYTFGDTDVASQEIQAFNFSAATPRRLFPRGQRAVETQVASPSQEKTADGVDADNADEDHSDVDIDFDVDVDVEAALSPGMAGLDFDDTVIISPVKDSSGGDVEDDVEPISEELKNASTTPPGLPMELTFVRPSTLKTNRALFRDQDAEDSDDELSGISSFRASNSSISNKSIATPTPGLKINKNVHSNTERRLSGQDKSANLDITPLAHQFNNWLAASGSEANPQKSTNSSPTKLTSPHKFGTGASPVKPSYFEDEILVRDTVGMEAHDEDNGEDQRMNFQDEEPLDVPAPSFEVQLELQEDVTMSADLLDVTVPMNGDFTMPMDVDIAMPTADPLELNMTPAQAVRPPPREVRTVSKVPLKESDDKLPLTSLRKKTKSLAPADFGELMASEFADIEGPSAADFSLSPGPVPTEVGTPAQSIAGRMSVLGTPVVDDNLMHMATPFRTPRVGADAQILRGAVVFVDVHTTEGSDASGLFVELLTQMGARCVKSWSWNPRSSTISGNAITPGGSKVGITHVVYKDGGKRTLEKVREARGLVNCVGVGWVLDCERENKWLDETDYAVDTSSIPRGGHNRRKSMEPKALANINGTLRPTSGASNRSVSTPTFNISPTKEFLTFSNVNSPVDDKDMPSFDAPTPTINFGAANLPVPETPAVLKGQDWNTDADGNELGKTPTTPYFMSKGAELVQATCPPKQQTGRMLFHVSGRIEDEPDEEVRRRLVLARRKSLQWAPKVGSPLRRE